MQKATLHLFFLIISLFPLKISLKGPLMSDLRRSSLLRNGNASLLHQALSISISSSKRFKGIASLAKYRQLKDSFNRPNAVSTAAVDSMS